MKKDLEESINKKESPSSSEKQRNNRENTTKRRKDRFMWSEGDVKFTKSNND